MGKEKVNPVPLLLLPTPIPIILVEGRNPGFSKARSTECKLWQNLLNLVALCIGLVGDIFPLNNGTAKFIKAVCRRMTIG